MERVSRKRCAAATNKLELGNTIRPAASEGTIQNPKTGVLSSIDCIPFLAAGAALYLTLVSQSVTDYHFRISTQIVTFET